MERERGRNSVCTACVFGLLRRCMTHDGERQGERMERLREGGEDGMGGKEGRKGVRRKKKKKWKHGGGDKEGERRGNFLRHPTCNDLSFMSRRRSLSPSLSFFLTPFSISLSVSVCLSPCMSGVIHVETKTSSRILFRSHLCCLSVPPLPIRVSSPDTHVSFQSHTHSHSS